MKSIEFRESNRTYFKPESMTDEECSSLPVFQNEKYIISKWRLGLIERMRILFSGHIWLWIHGCVQPPVSLDVKSPFIEKEKETPNDKEGE